MAISANFGRKGAPVPAVPSSSKPAPSDWSSRSTVERMTAPSGISTDCPNSASTISRRLCSGVMICLTMRPTPIASMLEPQKPVQPLWQLYLTVPPVVACALNFAAAADLTSWPVAPRNLNRLSDTPKSVLNIVESASNTSPAAFAARGHPNEHIKLSVTCFCEGMRLGSVDRLSGENVNGLGVLGRYLIMR